jgi:hypothetical protein
MPFRVLVIGPSQFRDYPRLRDVLDVVLANRVPDVELLTLGGSGLPSLVASYARMRKLEFRFVPLEQQPYPVEQLLPNNLELVLSADATVFFWHDSGGGVLSVGKGDESTWKACPCCLKIHSYAIGRAPSCLASSGHAT